MSDRSLEQLFTTELQAQELSIVMLFLLSAIYVTLTNSLLCGPLSILLSRTLPLLAGTTIWHHLIVYCDTYYEVIITGLLLEAEAANSENPSTVETDRITRYRSAVHSFGFKWIHNLLLMYMTALPWFGALWRRSLAVSVISTCFIGGYVVYIKCVYTKWVVPSIWKKYFKKRL